MTPRGTGPARLRVAPAPPPGTADRLRLVPTTGQASLDLEFPLPSGRPARPRLAAGLHLVPAEPLGPDDDERDPPTPRAQLPDPGPWCARLVQAAVEAASGDRPVAQLLRWTSREVYEQVRRQAAPALARPTERRRSLTRPVVRSLHAHEPADGVVEACATVHDRGRARAVALRLEGLGGRWVCTALDVL